MRQQTCQVQKVHHRQEQRATEEVAQQIAQDAQLAALSEHEVQLAEEIAGTIFHIDEVLGQIAIQGAL